MTDPKTCPRCGAPLTADGEPCPRCLLELGRSTPEAKPGEAGGTRVRARKRASPTVEEIARRFPELEIVARIGEGGMGTVYKARQPRIDRMVALKVLALDPVDDPTFAERFRREAMVLARLDHPNIVKLYDFGEREGLFYLVLEFVDGTNLRTLMKQALLAPAQALAIVPQMCEALQFAHDEGVVHRDIKPENVLVDLKGRVKIADFGLAKLVDADVRDVSLTEVGQVMGTPHYMAPEQLRGSREVDHRADIYSLGVVFYEMLTGELPRGNFELPSKRVHIDVRLDEIVLKSLERTPERRYQHAVEVKTDVEGVSSGPARSPGFAGVAIGHARGVKVGHSAVAIHPNKAWEFFLTFLILWPLVGLMFNGGAWWFTLGMALVGATFWSQIEHAIKARPQLAEALKSESHGAKAARHLAAISLLGIGLVALFAAHVSLFGFLAPDYRPGPDDPDSMRALETQLVPVFQSSMHLELPNIVLHSGVLSSLDSERIWTPGVLLLLAPLLLAAAAFALSAKPSSRRDWRPTLVSTATLLGSLILIDGFCAILAASRVQGARLVPALDSQLAMTYMPASVHGPEAFEDRLRIALVRQEFSITASGSWTFEAPAGQSGPTELRVLFAEPNSVFDRWHVSWFGPRRTEPHAVFVLWGPLNNGSTFVGSDLGSVRGDGTERRDWSDWLARTLNSTQ